VDDPADATTTAGCVVLVEGRSDVAALRVLGRRLGLEHPRVRLVAMDGVTNTSRHLAALSGSGAAVVGLCDAGEVRFVVGALRRTGHDVLTRADLVPHGFFVCDDDLEDELLRAVGADAAAGVVAGLGEAGRLQTFRTQPAQRERALHAQLHRFAGTTSGRKERFAAALAEAVALDRVPAPLRGVLEVARRAAAT
jgi:hypothetical protein